MIQLDDEIGLDNLVVNINEGLQNILTTWGVSKGWVIYTKLIILILIVLILVYLLQFIVNKILKFSFQHIHKITKLSFFKYTIKNKLPHYLALVVPYSFVKQAIPVVFWDFKKFINPLIKLTDIYMIFMIIWTVMSVIRSLGDVLLEKAAFKNKPMKSYMQVIQIIFFIWGAVSIYCILTGKSVTAFFAAMGAASAILMLMFQDTIKGFAGSIQVSANDMVRIGDWITMTKYGADGCVEEIALTSVKVRNFDNTITTIPTYSLISDSFQNWRGMQESGGRRIRKILYIKQDTIHFLSDEEIKRFQNIGGLNSFIKKKQEEYATRNKNEQIDKTLPLNEHRLTNCELFICYATNYINKHPYINKDMTCLVRQLSPSSQGLPIEVYTFSSITAWIEYENLSTEIMNHIISVVPFFGLTIHEESTGSDDYNIYIKENIK